MRVDVLMPKMGESITEGRILKWLKKPGDKVERDETILEIATDKVDTEVPSPAAGILSAVNYNEGDTVEVGLVIAAIDTESDAVAESASAAPQAGSSQPSQAPSTVESPDTRQPGTGDTKKGKRFYSPVVMRIAAENEIPMSELETIEGSGASGRVTKADISAYLERGTISPAKRATAGDAGAAAPFLSSAAQPAAPSGQGVEVVSMNNMQRLMAQHMVESKRISPHVVLATDADMSAVVRFRDASAEDFKRREGLSLTFMPFIADAAIRALRDFPLVNSSVRGEEIVIKHFVNLGIAVAMDDGGLIVPVVRHAEELNLTGLARALADVAGRARNRRLQPEEIQDGTFTITNFGVFGSVWGMPIINQPQVAILGIGALVKKPVVVQQDGQDAIAIRPTMTITLSFDHRIIDGALGARYLEKVKENLEKFAPPAM